MLELLQRHMIGLNILITAPAGTKMKQKSGLVTTYPITKSSVKSEKKTVSIMVKLLTLHDKADHKCMSDPWTDIDTFMFSNTRKFVSNASFFDEVTSLG